MRVVDTPSGRVAGSAVGGDGIGVHRFLGIPYGEAPVGPLRLRPPVPVAPWVGVLDAKEYPRRAVQPASFLAPPKEDEGEDCLGLNVWTPDLDGSAPVMVWIHGGSFTTGSGALSFYDGERLAARGVVVVSINYRLGALGFLDLEAVGGEQWAGCTNVGLQDQELALRWVRDHIGAFGGDPQRVTVSGESAGAMSVSVHLGRPASTGLFHRAIAQSGAATHVQTPDAGAAAARRALEILGATPSTLGRLLDLPAEAFRDVVTTMANELPTELPLPFRPTYGGTGLPIAPVDAIAAGSAADVPVLTGTNRDEFNLFRFSAILAGAPPDLDDARLERRVGRAIAARRLDVTAHDVIGTYRTHHAGVPNGDLWSAISTDLSFRLPMIATLDAIERGGGPAWSYHFEHESTGLGGGLGAAHAVEIPFVFDNLHQPGAEVLLGEITPGRAALAADLADRWVAFAAGEPLTVPGTGEPWPHYSADRREQVALDVESRRIARHEDDLRALWSRPGSGTLVP